MKELYIEGIASHDDPESCVGVREGDGEALTGARAGQVLSREIKAIGVPRRSSTSKATPAAALCASRSRAPRGLRPCCMYGTSMRENREVPCPPTPLTESGPPREDQGRTPRMYGHGKSDLLVVPAKLSNNGQGRRRWWREGGDARGAWAKPHAPDSVPEQAGNRRGPRHARQTLGRKRCWSRLAERSPVRRLTRARSPLR